MNTNIIYFFYSRQTVEVKKSSISFAFSYFLALLFLIFPYFLSSFFLSFFLHLLKNREKGKGCYVYISQFLLVLMNNY